MFQTKKLSQFEMSEAAVRKFQAAIIAAMANAYKEGLGADFTLLCKGLP